MKFILYFVGAIVITGIVWYLITQVPWQTKQERKDNDKSTISYLTMRGTKISKINLNLSFDATIDHILKDIKKYNIRSKEFNDYKVTDEGLWNYIRIRYGVSFLLKSTYGDKALPSHSDKYYYEYQTSLTKEQIKSIDLSNGGLGISFDENKLNRNFYGKKIIESKLGIMLDFITDNHSNKFWNLQLKGIIK